MITMFSNTAEQCDSCGRDGKEYDVKSIEASLAAGPINLCEICRQTLQHMLEDDNDDE